MTDTIPAYIAERIRRAPPAAVPVVAGSTPVIAFGPFRQARVATLGLNPSKHEFLDTQGRELDAAQRRLETLDSLGVASLATASDHVVAQVLAGCDSYFQRNPYRRWFNQLQQILDACGVAYADGSAAHLDLSQWATDPIWRFLDWPTRERLLREDTAFLRQQLEMEQIEVVLLNGRGAIDTFQWAFNSTLTPLPERLSGGRLHTQLVQGSLGGCAVIGWSTNIQSSFGVTRELRQQLAETVGRLVGQVQSAAHQARITALADERITPPSERRQVRLEGMTTVDGEAAPCWGRITLKRYATHVFGQWGINRMDGALLAYEGLALPLVDLGTGQGWWTAAAQRVVAAIHHYHVRGRAVATITSWGFDPQSRDPHDLEQLIEALRFASAHKGLCFGAVTCERVELWRVGFYQAFAMLTGMQVRLVPEEIWWQIAQGRGWQVRASLPWDQMRARGMTEAEMIDELLAIDIEAWQRTYGDNTPGALEPSTESARDGDPPV